MASLLQFLLLAALISLSTADTSTPPPSPTSPPHDYTFYQHDSSFRTPSSSSHFQAIIPILADLGFHDLASAAQSISPSSPAYSNGPVTIFAPSDASVRTCQSCSVPILLQEHSVSGFYPLDYLRKVLFGTKVETILPGRCLTITATANGSKIYIGGAEITHPNLFSNGNVIIHGLQGYVSHLSPYSCSIDRVTSLSLPHPSPSYAVMRLMIADAMVRLRTSGYSVLALAIRVKYPELVTLQNMTIFALDDVAIFHGGHAYVRDVRFHIVPNRHLMLHDLEKLPAETGLPTLEEMETLTVTTGAGGGLMTPLRINYVRMKTPDLIHNPKIVIHGLGLPFPHLHIQSSMSGTTGGVGGFGFGFSNPMETEIGSETAGVNGMAPSPVVESVSEMEDRHGL